MTKKNGWTALQVGLSVAGTVAGIVSAIATVLTQRQKIIVLSHDDYLRLSKEITQSNVAVEHVERGRISFELRDFQRRKG